MEKIPKVILFGVFFAEFVFAIYLAIESKAELFGRSRPPSRCTSVS